MSSNSCHRGHAIVCGFGHLGSRIASLLRSRGCDVTVIDQYVDELKEKRSRDESYRLIEGDIRNDDVLSTAGVDTAACLLAITGDDSANLQAAITARELNPEIEIVIRLYDQSFARQVESAFDFHALSASFLASPAYLSAATEDSLIAMLSVDGSHMSVHIGQDDNCSPAESVSVIIDGPDLRVAGIDAKLPPESQSFRVSVQRPDHRPHNWKKFRLARRSREWSYQFNPIRVWHSLADIWTRAPAITKGIMSAFVMMGLLSVLIFSYAGGMHLLDALYFVVTTMTTVGYGDFNLQNSSAALKIYGIIMMLCGAGLLATIYAIIADRVLTARVEYLLGRRNLHFSGHTVVVGLGKVGYRVAHDLKMLGVEVVGIEAREDTENIGSARAHFPVIIGDAARLSILSKAAVENADVLLALTDDDMLNLSIALHAREHNKNIKTIVRTYDPVLVGKFAGFGFDHVISTSAIAAPAFVDAAMYRTVRGSFICHGKNILVATRKIEPQSDLDGLTPAEAGSRMGIAVVLGRYAGQNEYSVLNLDTPLSAGMCVVTLLPREQADLFV